MDIWEFILIIISWYSIVGTIVGGALIAVYFYLKYIKKYCVNKILVTGMVLIAITVFIFLGFLLFGFMYLGFAQQ